MSALSDRLNEARGDRSVREIGRAANKVNGTGESTVIPYFNGKHGTPSLPVLTALADVLDVPLSELRTAAGLPAGERLPYKPPAEADLLSRSQRTALDALIKSIVETRGADHDADTKPASDADRPPASGTPRETHQGKKNNVMDLKPDDSSRRTRRGRDFTADPIVELPHASDDRGPEDEGEAERERRLQDQQGEEPQDGDE
ncbi:helix-turn-helix domain-containing protein [Gordonia sihwensis]|uniref:helix-turn-helix domain-containing protein n=1 Tax=Gordonia sihwensis TaxID=173559 RepID=UPI002416E51E|nr:helix-turn-helix transcriptional regulator [Gordonia sihwensis]WFN91514.1 helix-turn-helix transcriptional regulator [Gordonia sihwensis]WFN91572.1 helix-turn-helix transcriptional regulator [Gordonia sihwensis]